MNTEGIYPHHMEVPTDELIADAMVFAPCMSVFYHALRLTNQHDPFVLLLKQFNSSDFSLAEFRKRSRALFSSDPEMYALFCSVWIALGGTPAPPYGPPTLQSAVESEFAAKRDLCLFAKNKRP